MRARPGPSLEYVVSQLTPDLEDRAAPPQRSFSIPRERRDTGDRDGDVDRGGDSGIAQDGAGGGAPRGEQALPHASGRPALASRRDGGEDRAAGPRHGDGRG